MRVDGFLIPDELVAALAAGRWPRTSAEANQQNNQMWVPAQGIQQLAPGEDKLYLYPPPFAVLARRLTGTYLDFYTRFCALDQIEPEVLIEIADFGLGSDSPIALDYRDGPEDPQVIRLKWKWIGREQANHWVLMAPDFATFAYTLGL